MLQLEPENEKQTCGCGCAILDKWQQSVKFSWFGLKTYCQDLFFGTIAVQKKGLQFISIQGTGGDLHSVWPCFVSSFNHCLIAEQCQYKHITS